jgi:hypothetical protein
VTTWCTTPSWDVPNYRWYELDGLRVGQTTSGNDLLIEARVQPCQPGAAAIACPRGARLGIWRRGVGTRPAEPVAGLVDRGCRTLWTPFARFDEQVAIEL